MSSFDLAGVFRRIRRRADLSQRELATRCEISQSAVARVETGHASVPVAVLVRAAAVAGLRLAMLDEEGHEVTGMDGNAVRDRAGRRFPAHLDTRYGDDGWWHGEHRYDREQPWYTFDRSRYLRDRFREVGGTPDDHQLPQAGDSPDQRRARRKAEAARRAEDRRRRLLEEHRARRQAAGLPLLDPFDCTCPPRCDELDDYSGRPVHTDDCSCRCDLG